MVSSRAVTHIVHAVHRFAAGGMENVIVQLVNGLPADRFRHTIIALTTIDASFTARIGRSDVEYIELNKPPGQPFRLYPKIFRTLLRIRPDVFHTGNLAALEIMPVAAVAGIGRRVHAEHGWDIQDPDGRNKLFIALRKAYRPFVHDYVAVSRQLYTYVRHTVGVNEHRVHLIPNGVDADRFAPRPPEQNAPPPPEFPFRRPDHFVIGTVGRLEPIKNQGLLISAFARLLEQRPLGSDRLRLALIGGGPKEAELRAQVQALGIEDQVWWGGTRRDIPDLLRSFDCFVLPSLSEGTSCTLQEAMSTALPIVATDVGGNSDLLEAGALGSLVPSEDVEGLARALGRVFLGQTEAQKGAAARHAILRTYALPIMLKRYEALFEPVP